MIRKSIAVLIMLAVCAPASSVNVASASVVGARGVIGIENADETTMDDCQPCFVEVEYSSMVDQYQANWMHYDNPSGICPEWAEACVRCWGDCSFAEGQDHFDTEEDAWGWIELQTNCPDDCSNGGEELIAVAATGAMQGEVGEFVSLLASSGGRVWFNSERRAVQGLGCQGVLALHVAVDDQRARAIQAAAAVYGISVER